MSDTGAVKGGVKKGGQKGQKFLKISKELEDLLGTSQVTRPKLTKKMWAYFKGNNLIDPSDKRYVLCDEKLKALTGEDRILGFSFQKHLTKHIIKDEEAKDEA